MENEKNTDKQGKTGGLYAKVNMSLKTANIMVTVFIVLLVAATVFIVSHSGFTVKFDTDGGSHIESVKVMHSQTVDIEEEPIKEGYIFTGWYTDRDCTEIFDIKTDTVMNSMTLYAGWEKAK
ncbi:MAG: InlB B-repeat-containing protein [Firmicutes bacterium]|nr:InlB B-repeat-containing protein [Bacillota bacterium]